MWRNEPNSVDGWPSMRQPHCRVSVQMVLRGPPSPMALDTRGRDNEDTIEIDKHCVALQLRHGRLLKTIAAECAVLPAAHRAGKCLRDLNVLAFDSINICPLLP